MSKIITCFFVKIYKVFILLLLFVNEGFALTLDEKIGQLFIVPACQLRGEDHTQDLERLIAQGKIGGVILKQGTIDGQRNLIDRLQSMSPMPLLCVQDAEWGVGMRLTDVAPFPRNLTLGAVQDLSLLYQLGQEIGRQCRSVGVHLNLAPVCDVNCNPLNPIIHTRSFGEDPLQVAVRSERVMSGIQSMGVFACAKHFPGHGDTTTDSHVDLPLVRHDLQRLKNVELVPFQRLIAAGIKVVMTAHLCVEALDAVPATFSRKIVTDLLQKELGFEGLVISDALNMKALSKYYSPEEIAVKALLAGHDLLLYGDHIAPRVDQILQNDVPKAFAAIKAAVQSGELPEALIDAKVAKILEVKKGIAPPTHEPLENLALQKKLFEEAITVVRNENDILPLKAKRVALAMWGEAPIFAERLQADRVLLDDPNLSGYDCLVIALVSQDVVDLPQFQIPTVCVVFGSPYRLAKLPQFEGMVVAYEKLEAVQEAAADVILGRLPSKGHLPVTGL
jgi:beta-glucosidase-like glycosyl hydrolase